MSFLSGRVTYTPYRVSGKSPGIFGPEHLAKLEDAAIGKQRVATSDGSQFGWVVGDHILNTSFDLEKNVVNDTLQFAIRIDEHRPPADLLRSYFLTELAALAAQNPSGHPSAKQKREARQVAKDRLEHEAKDGRFLKRKMVPLMWDGQANELLIGTTSASVIDRVHVLFRSTFERELEQQSAGDAAFAHAEVSGRTRMVDDAKPYVLVHGQNDEIAWIPDEHSRDFLGNEFLLWLWYTVENETDTIKLSDGSEVAVMLARMLQLECPKGQYGKESFTSDGPTKLPEAIRALQVGRLPRKAGLTIVRHDHPYEFAIQAESMSISSAKLPPVEEDSERAGLEERINQIRHLRETLALLYGAFLDQRFGYEALFGAMSTWLKRRAA